ncbi:glycosyltransferase [Lacrimispora sphenoides]|uniref:Glycosyl transferases group 1 n=1 Tax=Lacrimispora sphenoides JCM 1415 TaxID=1297793 RepID=A0ABY1CDY4_9FIRM|nr:glycosyltransferase [Lacrimispora sphenoides]SET96009.1 Glycosyl transferases group 1 [[Clostridium] sphenoides JCM 1415]SUY52741.1 Uncharacterised protein [Lacrimispora sphenoides]
MSRRLHVHVFCEYINSGTYMVDCAKIRIFGPLVELSRTGQIKFTYGKSLRENTDADIYVIERSWRDDLTYKEIGEFQNFITKNHKKYIFEIDDNLFDNDSVTNSKRNQLRQMVRHADLVIVSTPILKSRILRMNKNIKVIPNYLSPQYIGEKSWEEIAKQREEKNNIVTIGYMGTATHQHDFAMIKLPLTQLLCKYPDKVRFEVIGVLNDSSFLKSLPNVWICNTEGRSTYENFWPWIRENINWDIGVAPLKTDKFTVCKSDIKYLDYAAQGIAGVFSDHPAYSSTICNGENGLIVDANPSSWFAALERLVLEPELRKRIAYNAYTDLHTNRLVCVAAQKWQEAFINLISKDTESDETSISKRPFISAPDME